MQEIRRGPGRSTWRKPPSCGTSCRTSITAWLTSTSAAAGRETSVVDTNVIAYYWLPGANSENAVAVRRRTDNWFVPKLWRSEFRNVLARYLRAGSIGLEQANALIRGAEAELVGLRA